MKRVAANDITRVALAKGATIEHDGAMVNAARQRMQVVRREPDPPRLAAVPAPIQPPPPPPTLNLDAVVSAATAGHASVDKLAGLVALLVRAMQAQQAAAQKPVSGWDFEVHKDGNGRTHVRATAIRQEKT